MTTIETTTPASGRLTAHGLRLAYAGDVVVDDLDLVVLDHELTVVVGANGCGKSTLLRALARTLSPTAGAVHLDGRAIGSYPSKEVARRLGFLPQGPIAPDGITVVDLVGRGRYPHQGLLRQWSDEDEAATRAAMTATGVLDLAGRRVETLSGGQRQRVWLAMALAQETSVLLLDEPTTYLDVAHQVEVLDLCADLQELHGRTIVVVLHDLNHACRYATHLIAMRAGKVVAQGRPVDVVDAALVQDVFGLPSRVIPDPETGTPLVVPLRRRTAGQAGVVRR